ncbi:MAG: hypothetical protein WCD53_24620 [Microcoleus sp.]
MRITSDIVILLSAKASLSIISPFACHSSAASGDRFFGMKGAIAFLAWGMAIACLGWRAGSFFCYS